MNALLDGVVAVGVPIAPGDWWRIGERVPLQATVPSLLRDAVSRLSGDKGRVLAVGQTEEARQAASNLGVEYVDAGSGIGISSAVEQWVQRRAGSRFEHASASIVDVDEEAAAAAGRRHDQLAKPPGSLGRLEALGARLAAIAGVCPPPAPSPATVVVFAGDHGVVAEGVTPWPPEVTRQMVAVFAQGKAAVNVIADAVGASVLVVDVGMTTHAPAHANLLRRNVRRGTGNLAQGPALTAVEVALALDAGADAAAHAVAAGARCLVTGDMGIGNTTPAAAVISALTGRGAAEITGRGTGIDDDMLRHKVAVVEGAVARVTATDARSVLAEVGGAEIAAIAGFIVGAAAARVPVVVDGVVSAAGLVAAAALAPRSVGYAIAGHRSTEPGSGAVLEHLSLAPLLELDMRLGEGTGALLALPLLGVAASVLTNMATLGDAGIDTAAEAGSAPTPDLEQITEFTEFRDA